MNCVAAVTADPAIGAIADLCSWAEKSGQALAAHTSHPTSATPTSAVSRWGCVAMIAPVNFERKRRTGGGATDAPAKRA